MELFVFVCPAGFPILLPQVLHSELWNFTPRSSLLLLGVSNSSLLGDGVFAKLTSQSTLKRASSTGRGAETGTVVEMNQESPEVKPWVAAPIAPIPPGPAAVKAL